MSAPRPYPGQKSVLFQQSHGEEKSHFFMGDSLSDLPLDAQLAHAVKLLNLTAENWPTLELLTNLTATSIPPEHFPALEQPDRSDPKDPAEFAIHALTTVSDNAALASVISPNEQLDDIPTPHLKFLLLPYLTASAHSAARAQHEARLASLTSSSNHLTAFFTSMHDLRLLPADERPIVLPETDAEAVHQSHVPRREETREDKIRRFKADKAAERQLTVLLDRIRSNRTTAEHDDIDEAIRAASLVVLQSAVRRALNLHQAIARETPLLQWAQRQRQRGNDPTDRAQRSRARAMAAGPQSAAPGMPATFRIVNERERERERVFRPSHSLPTYTIEEWGEIQAERLASEQAEKQEKDVVARRKKEEEDSDGDEAADRATEEQRRWDDWKDEHNRGSGNTMR